MRLVRINETISNTELAPMASRMFGNLVKAVVDLEQEIMMVDADMHADQEEALLEMGSQQENLWGINLLPDKTGDDWLVFDSMINIRPGQNNRSRSVESPEIRARIKAVVAKLVTP